MKPNKNILAAVSLVVALATTGPLMAQSSQVMVTVGDQEITSSELEKALTSTPYATQFNTMDEDNQAALRGDMLRRLVTQRLLLLEARRLKLDESPEFLEELKIQRNGLLFSHYMGMLRSKITVPAGTLADMKKHFGNNLDGLAAAEASYKSDQYRTVRLMTIKSLRDKHKIRLYEERITPKVKSDTVLLEGDGIRITYGDIVDAERFGQKTPSPGWVKSQLYERAELLLVAMAAEKEGVNVDGKLQKFSNERLPAMLLEQKEREWISGDEALRAYYDKNPNIAKIAERYHIGQIVVADRKQADDLRKRILDGESLFELAGQYSIDEMGRKSLGDMGWVIEGRGYPQLEAALKQLKNSEVSEVIETPLGYHLVMVLDRRPGGKFQFEAIKDRIQQAMVLEKLSGYLKGLQENYKVTWLLAEHEPKEAGK